MSDHDEIPGFSGSGDPREEALWQAYQAMLRRRNEPRPQWSPEEPSTPERTPEPVAPWRPPGSRPLPAQARATDVGVDTPPFPVTAPREGSGRSGAWRLVALCSALLLAGAVLTIAFWPRGPAVRGGAEPTRGPLPMPAPPVASPARTSIAGPPPSVASPPIATPAPGLSAQASAAALPLAQIGRKPRREHDRARARRPTGEVSPRRASVLAVRGFYNALARGDGKRAAAMVAPDMREAGPLSAAELTRSYSSLRAPLSVTQIDPINDDRVFVRYHFVTADDHICLGSAIVNTTHRDGGALVSSVHIFHAC